MVGEASLATGRGQVRAEPGLWMESGRRCCAIWVRERVCRDALRWRGQLPLLAFTQAACCVLRVACQITGLPGRGVGATHDGLKQHGVFLGPVELAAGRADAPIEASRL